MRSDRPSQSPRRFRSRVPSDLPAQPPAGFEHRSDDDRRPFRWAIAAAVVVHAALLLAPLPYSVEAAPDPEAETIFVVQPVRFKPPKVDPTLEIPEPRTLRVPIPDTTPHELEPLRTVTELERLVNLPPIDWDVVVPGDAPPPPEQPSGPLVIGGPVSRPVKVAGPMPVYPETARRVRFECTVLLRAVIDEAGRVVDIQPVRPCPFGMTESATDAVRKWRYEPALRHGLPVPVYMQLRVDFTLR